MNATESISHYRCLPYQKISLVKVVNESWICFHYLTCLRSISPHFVWELDLVMHWHETFLHLGLFLWKLFYILPFQPSLLKLTTKNEVKIVYARKLFLKYHRAKRKLCTYTGHSSIIDSNFIMKAWMIIRLTFLTVSTSCAEFQYEQKTI